MNTRPSDITASLKPPKLISWLRYYRPCKRHNPLTNQISTLNNRPIKMNSFIPKSKTYNNIVTIDSAV